MQALRIRDSRLTKERKCCAIIAHTPSTGPDLTEATSASRHPTDMEATVEMTTASEPETSVRDTVVTDYPGMEAAGDAAPAAGHEPQEVVPVIGDDEPHVDAAAAGEAAPQDATVVTDRNEPSEAAAAASGDEPSEAAAATDGNEPQETTAAA